MCEISIVIPTLNRYVDLLNTIRDLNVQTITAIEIIVIDQTVNADSKNLAKLKKCNHLRYFYSALPSASAARNIGIKEANAEIILFLDDDVIIKDKNYLKNIINHFQLDEVVGVVGPIIDSKTLSTRNDRHKWSYNKYWGWLFFPRNYMKACMINDGGAGNLAVRRKNAIAIGGMYENYRKGAHREEADFNTRYTRKFGWYVYDPLCAIIHIGRNTGGVRSWNKSLEVKAQHHFDGAIYYILKNVRLKHYPIHFAATFLYFVLKKEYKRKPSLFFKSFYRFNLGLIHAVHLLKKGPQYLLNE